MTVPPNTRATRSRYSSPAVGPAGQRVHGGGGSGSRDRDRNSRGDKDRDDGHKERRNGAAGRPSSTDRSRQFMENWIEPERARLASFQEAGLIRQGVLETMEPLGTRPKPAMIKKLVGAGREASPTAAARKPGSGTRKIVLKRKNGAASIGASSGHGAGLGGPGLSLPDTQSLTPSSAVATPEAVPSPTSTPATAAAPTAGLSPSQTKPPSSKPALHQASSPAPTPAVKAEQRTPTPAIPLLSDAISDQPAPPSRTPEPATASSHARSQRTPSVNKPRLPSSVPHIPPVTTTFPSKSHPFLPDPIKQSVEGLSLPELPTTPRSIASTYDTDDDLLRESPVQSSPPGDIAHKHRVGTVGSARPRSSSAVDSTMDRAISGPSPALPADGPQNKPQLRPTGPNYTESELARIIQQQDVVRTSIQRGIAEALSHYQYTSAYALRLVYDHNQTNARFLLLTEAIFTQNASREAAGEWARKLHPYIKEGSEDNTAFKYFVPEARIDENYKPPQPVKAPYSHLVSIDLGEVRKLHSKRKRFVILNKATPEGPEQLQKTMQQAEEQDHAESHEGTEAEAEAEPDERVATPPRKRQKTAKRDFSAARNKTPGLNSSTRVMNGGKMAVSPMRRRTRAGSNISDVSSLTSMRSAASLGELEEKEEKKEFAPAATKSSKGKAPARAKAEPQAVENENEELQDEQVDINADVKASARRACAKATTGPGTGTGLKSSANGGKATEEQTSGPNQGQSQPITGTRTSTRRAPARRARYTGTSLASNASPPAPDSNSNALFSNSNKPSAPLTSNTLDDQPTNTNDNSINNTANTTTKLPANAAAPDPVQPKQAKQLLVKKSKRGMPDFSPQYQLDPDDEAAELRRSARARTLRLTNEVRAKDDSFVRGSAEVKRPESSQSSLSSAPDIEELGLSPEPVRPAATTTRATRSNKRTHDDVDRPATPASLAEFPVERGPSTGVTSRAGTPRPTKKRRLKHSPVKNKSGPSAGVPRGGSRVSPGLTGNPAAQEENDDFCSSCGGNGNLVCCDGCTRAFHKNCHDPPVDPDEDEDWYCHDCMVKRDPGLVKEYVGPFGLIMTNLDKKHSTSYRLPKDIRECFEGVRTGIDGEYEEYRLPVKGNSKKKKDEAVDFDFFQIVDKDNSPILCHSCHQSASEGRAIFPCTICGLWWHSDCLDPPRPNPPKLDTFVCPCHIDDVLLKIPAQMGPAHRFRKMRGFSEIDYAYRRGNVNNGHVEISDNEDGAEGPPTFRDPDSYGRSYRLRASGIQEDFMAKFGRRRRDRVPQSKAQPIAQLPAADYREDAEERYDAALSILSLSRNSRPERGRRPDNSASNLSGVICSGDSVISAPSIETASNTELQAFQATLTKLQQQVQDKLNRQGLTVGHVSDTQPSSSSHDVPPNSGSVSDTPHVGQTQKSNTATKVVAETSKSHASSNASKRNVAETEHEKDIATVGGDKTAQVGNAAETDAKMASQLVHESALTPVSDAAKDGDDLSHAVTSVKHTLNGIETPETDTHTVDQAASPAEADAEAMSLD